MKFKNSINILIIGLIILVIRGVYIIFVSEWLNNNYVSTPSWDKIIQIYSTVNQIVSIIGWTCFLPFFFNLLKNTNGK